MAQVLLDFNLATDLLLDAAVDNLHLVQALEGDDEVGSSFGAREVNTTELALAEWAANLERGEGEGD